MVTDQRVGDSDTYELFLADADGANPVRIELADPWGPVWSPDGSKLILNSDGKLYVVDADGTGLRVVREWVSRAPEVVWSPDSTKLALVGLEVGGLEIVDVDTGATVTIAASSGRPTWTADSRTLAFFGHAREKTGLFIAPADGSKQRLLAAGQSAGWPFISPDGGLVAYMENPAEDRLQVVVMDTQTLEERVVFEIETHGGSVEDRPFWSPDGKRLVMVLKAMDHPGAFVMNADGSGWQQLVATLGTDVVEVRWLDGTRVYFETAYQGPG